MAGYRSNSKEYLRYRVGDVRANSKDERVYKAKFAGITDNLIIFDKGPYKVCEKRNNYRKTWKVRMI